MNCPDGNPCETWFIADGSLVCRHGVCAFQYESTDSEFQCPAELIQQYSEKRLKEFFEIINKMGLIRIIKAIINERSEIF